MNAALELLPAVDISGGRAAQVVGDHGSADPWTVAAGWQDQGAAWVHLVDLDRAFGRGANDDLVVQVIGRLDVPVQLSGGIVDAAGLERALATGCRRVNLGTRALADPDWVLHAVAEHGDRVAVGLDVAGSTLAARGADTGRADRLGDVFTMLDRLEAGGCARYVVTDTARDGQRSGANLELLRRVCARTTTPVVSSGGVAVLDDLEALAALVPSGVEGTVLGAALYHGAFTLADALELTRAGAGGDGSRV